jgi:hypothetical protein
MALPLPGAAAGNDVVAHGGRMSVPEWQAKNRGEHQTEWSAVRYATNPATGRVRATTNSYVEIGTSLNRMDTATGQWVPSDPSFQVTDAGVEANWAGHRVRINGNINAAGAVQIEKDGVRLQGHPLCIAYFDPVDGRSLSLGELTEAAGGAWLVASNEIVFSNCFDGIRASIRYRNSIDGIESDLILHERPPVTPQDIGFSDRTRLELFTEWIGDTPLPQKETRLLLREKDTEARKQMAEPDFTDATLTFGPLRMARGKAFSAGGTNAPLDAASAPDAVTVGKRFEIIDGRKILIEAVEHRSVSSLLGTLPAAPLSGVLTNAALNAPTPEGESDHTEKSRVRALAVRKKVDQTTDQSIRWLPAKRLAQTKVEYRIQAAANSKPGTRNAELAAVEPPAFVLDWQLTLTSGLTDFTLSSATNYLCAGTINFNGTTRIQGGTVVKFAPAPATARLKFSGPVICDTDMHHPAYFVSKFDRTVGEVMDANATPASYTGALELTTTGNKLKHLRIRNANIAVQGWDVDVSHSQFTECNTVFYMPESGAGSGPCRLGNVLVNNCGYIFSGTYYNVIATHLTVNNCYGALTSDPYDRSTAHFINSLLVNIDSMGAVESPILTSSQVLPATPAVFQTVGGGALYLAAGSTHRGAGITTIDPVLLQELKQTTTWPPEILTGTLAVNRVLPPNPLVPRNANPNPDRGYAYPAMDYLVRNLVIQGSSGSPVTLLVTNGAVLGFDPITSGSFGNGLSFGAYTDFISVGTPAALNRFVLSHAIQESCPTVPNYFTLLHSSGLSPYAGAFLRFSDLSLSAGLCRHLAHWNGGFIKLAFHDSQIRGGTMYLGSDLLNHFVALTNTLVERVDFTHHPYAVGTFHAYNNLFKGGSLTFDINPPGLPLPVSRDNLFDRTAISQAGGPNMNGDYNAYVQVAPSTPRLQPQGANDRPLLTASPAYEAGPFGKYYLPSSATSLINQGSRSAANAGLYHFTTSITAATKESATQVDIGLHYVGANSANLPIDTDTDGLADYVEDGNGDNVLDTGETSYQDTDTDYDGRSDRQELVEDGTNPLESTSFKPVRLGYWRFNNAPGWLGEAGQPPMNTLGTLANPTSWSGKALHLNSANPANLKYRDVESGGLANINCKRGTIRFWFKPDWAPNVGPDGVARLIAMGNDAANPAEGWWALSITPPEGQPALVRIKFESRSGGGSTTERFSGPIQWEVLNNVVQWHQFTLTYDNSETRLYVNGQSVLTGSALVNFPNATERTAYGFSIGSNRFGTEQAKGQYEEFETFNHVLTSGEIASNYGSMTQASLSAAYVLNNNYVRTTALNFEFVGGPTAELAILVDSENFASAIWSPYVATAAVTIPNTQGQHDVWFGFRDIFGNVNWRRTRVYLDTVPPGVTITAPTGTTSTKPMIQIQAYGNEPLSSVSFDLQNSSGTTVDQKGFVLGNVYTTVGGQPVFVRADFQCFDVNLDGGVNIVTIRATDLAGNVTPTVRTYTFSTAGDTTPPSIAVTWPPDNALVSGNTFTLIGTVDDETASVLISGLTTDPIVGSVERNGKFSFSSLPLAGGSQSFTITATDSAGNPSAMQRTVQKSTLNIQMNPLSPAEIGQKKATITGTVGAGVANVTVNGVVAPVANGQWTATDVPISNNGQASVLITATDPVLQQPVQIFISLDGLPRVRVSRYEETVHLFEDTINPREFGGTYVTSLGFDRAVSWASMVGGSSSETAMAFNELLPNNPDATFNCTASFTWPANETGPPETIQNYNHSCPERLDVPWNQSLATQVPWEFCDVDYGSSLSSEGVSSSGRQGRFAQTEFELLPGGTEEPGLDVSLLVTATAKEFPVGGVFPNSFTTSWEGDIPLPAERILLNGQPMQPHPDDPNKGIRIITVPSGRPTKLYAQANPVQNNHYSFKVEDLSRIDIKEVISDQIAGNECNKLPTAVFPHPNNPMLMATRSGLDTRLAVRIDFPSVFAGKIYVGVRRIGTQPVLGSTVAQVFPNRTLLQFNAISQLFDDPVYEVVAGYDGNNNGTLDNSEAVIVFSKTPKGKATAADIKNRLDKIIVITPTRVNNAYNLLYVQGNVWGTDYAGDLLEAFVIGSTTLDTATTTTGVLLSSTHPSLTHPVGATWNTACQATTIRFTFPDGVEASNDFEESNALLQIIDSTVTGNLSALLASGTPDFAISTTMSFSKFINFGLTEPGGFGEINELNLAFGRVTINGSLRVRYRKTSATSIEVSEVDISGSFDDLYDFDYSSGGNARRASMVQAGHATISTPPSGRVFFTRLEFNTGWRSHQKTYP